jgi:hypothetical protein
MGHPLYRGAGGKAGHPAIGRVIRVVIRRCAAGDGGPIDAKTLQRARQCFATLLEVAWRGTGSFEYES